MVDDGVSPDVFDTQREANTSKLATQMHASGDALKVRASNVTVKLTRISLST